jgi:hypothetical protein
MSIEISNSFKEWRIFKITKNNLRKILPASLKKWLKQQYFNLTIKPTLSKLHQKALVKIRKKDKIKAAFFLIHNTVWKYEGVYRLMENDDRFEPIVIVCPYVIYGQENMQREMNQAYNAFLTKGYNVVKTYNEATKEWLDIKKEIKPDIIFFTNPHEITKDEYYITNFLDRLTCYVPYGFMIANLQETQFNQPFHNFIWRCYYETQIHKEMSEKYADNKGSNVLVTGFPMCDIFLDKTYVSKDKWKIKDKSVKRIIWAPHHTIEDNDKKLAYSNFLNYHQFMLDLLKIYNGQIQIAFKPHPILKPELYKHSDWGIDRTDAYYKTWQSINNGQLEEEGYEDLFLTSDAMILDSSSFISEYCYTGKPSLFMVRDATISGKFNEYGAMAFNLMYKSQNTTDILNFINDTVLNGYDPLLKERAIFVDKYLKPPNNQSATFNIFNNIIREITQ